MRNRMRSWITASFALTALGLAACGDDDPSAPGGGTMPAHIAVLSGDNQRVSIGGRVLAPLRVRVTDTQNRGVSGVTVNWQVTEGGGWVSGFSRATSTTDNDGEAIVEFVAGGDEEESTITASVSGVSGTATFTVVALAPASIAVASGDNQEVRTGISLAEELVVRVTASDGGPVPGTIVDWAVTAGDLSMSESSSTTNADGRAAFVGVGTAVSAGAIEVTARPRAAAHAVAVRFHLQASVPVTVTVTMENIAFNAPGGGDITIMRGDTVRWLNTESVAVDHTATSTQTPAGGTPFDSGLLSPGEEFSVVPNARGVWIYRCEEHPTTMVDARITVR